MDTKEELLIDIMENADDDCRKKLLLNFSNVKRLIAIHKKEFNKLKAIGEDGKYTNIKVSSWNQFIRIFLSLSKQEKIEAFKKAHSKHFWCDKVLNAIDEDEIQKFYKRVDIISYCLDGIASSEGTISDPHHSEN